MVHNSLTRGAGRRIEEMPDIDESIYLKHRVFTKVGLSPKIDNFDLTTFHAGAGKG